MAVAFADVNQTRSDTLEPVGPAGWGQGGADDRMRRMMHSMPSSGVTKQRFVSLGTKAAVPIAAALAIVGLLVALALGAQMREQIVAGKVTAATMVAELLSAAVVPALDFDDTQTLGEELARLTANPDVIYAAVWRLEGLVPVAEFRPGTSTRPGRPPKSQVDVMPDSVVVSKVLKGQGGATLGAITVRFSLERENERVGAARRTIAGLIGLLALTVAATIFAVSRSVVISPLRQLTEAARRVELGSVEPVRLEANDEIGQLARGFNAMAGAIAEREQRLASLNRGLEQLVDNMRQAIVVFMEGGLLAPVRSRRTEELFGRGVADVACVQDLLFPNADNIVAAAFDQWVHAAFGVPIDAWADVAPLAPSTVILAVGTQRERVLALDFRAIEENGKIDRIMMLASDETQVRHLERAVKEQEEEHERQMSAMRRLMAGGGQLLVSVLDRGRERLSACDALIDGATGALETSLVEALFQHAHSIKGEARAFDLVALDASASELEDFLAILRGRLRKKQQRLTVDEVRPELSQRLGSTRDALSRAAEMLVQASPIGAAVLNHSTKLVLQS